MGWPEIRSTMHSLMTSMQDVTVFPSPSHQNGFRTCAVTTAGPEPWHQHNSFEDLFIRMRLLPGGPNLLLLDLPASLLESP